MRKIQVVLGLLGVLACASITLSIATLPGTATASNLSQNTPAPTPLPAFEIVQQIGLALPNRIVYDRVLDRYAVVDAYNRLLLVNGSSFETEHVLYERGSYNDLGFSNDGRFLALAIDTRIELWDTQTGTIAADLVDLSQARRIHGPLTFSRDDETLLFFGTYPAPQELRRTENDTTTVPWLWHLPSAREESASTLPNGVEAYPFFDYRNGFVLGPDDRIVAALPSRLHVIDAKTTEVLYEIPTDRYEQDPLDVRISARDNRLYVRPVEVNTLIQVDTQRGVLVEIPLTYEGLSLSDVEALGGVELSEQARVIGEVAGREFNPLIGVLFGDPLYIEGRDVSQDYRRDERWRLNPLTVTLIDLLAPASGDQLRLQALLFVFDERDERGYFVLSSPYAVEQMVLSPDGNEVILRRNEGEELVEIFNLDSGEVQLSVIPATRALGRYSPDRKNRALRYGESGTVFVSDFQKFNVETGDVVAEDLRYSRRFDRFFWSNGDANIVTLSDTEWRLWNVATGELERRQVLPVTGSIVATSSDGVEYLTRYGVSRGQAMEIFNASTGERRTVVVEYLAGRDIAEIIPSPDWEHFLVVYSSNEYNAYYPGNEVAIYSMANGKLHFYAGDDLPPSNARRYGWVDNERVYIYGEQPAAVADRIPPRELIAAMPPLGSVATDKLPDCVGQQFEDEQLEFLIEAWTAVAPLYSDESVSFLVGSACGGGDQWEEWFFDLVRRVYFDVGVEGGILPTPTLAFIDGAPACVASLYPERTSELAAEWTELTGDLPPELQGALLEVVCVGAEDLPGSGNSVSGQATTMMINVGTGERLRGRAPSEPEVSRPIEPVLDEFQRTERRSMGSARLSPSEQLVAASSQPGELIIYRFINNVSYEGLIMDVTATAAARIASQNRIVVEPSPTATLALVGTARPTLTPTTTPTAPVRPDEVAYANAQDVNLCPAETLFSPDNPPPNYSPTGRIVGPVQGDELWAINPVSGRREPDPTIPTCGFGFECNLSPDNRWILATNLDGIYVVRPDGSDIRALFEGDEPWTWPTDIRWTGANTVEYTVQEPHPFIRGRVVDMLQRDILGVFPDPEPYFPVFDIRNKSATLVARQPGGDLAVAYVTFSTGIAPGYEYYLYNTATDEVVEYFSRLSEFPPEQLRTRWHPLGDRLFYRYPMENDADYSNIWYVYDFEAGTHRRIGLNLPGGVWSTDGRYTVYQRDSRTQPIGVWDSETGETRSYCVPETGARFYEGPFYWSPDNRYIALQTTLPADESDEDVGQHVLVLDVATGSVTDVTFGGGRLFMWAQGAGTYGGE